MNTCYKIFVYGSLRSGFKSEAYNYISKYFNFIATAKVQGVVFDMGTHPVAKPSNDNFFIEGELFEIKNELEFNFAIAQLDDYEGLYPEDDEQQLYARQQATIYLNNEQTITQQAWVYWFIGNTNGKPILHNGNFLVYKHNK